MKTPPEVCAVARPLRPPGRSWAKASRGVARTAGRATPRRGCKIVLGLLVSVSLLASIARARAQAGNNNPTGATGQFNGNVTTAGSYDPYTGSATRSVTDLVVAGAVGQYGLSYTRTWNSREGNAWRHSFAWKVRDVIDLRAGRPVPYTVAFPDGRSITFGPPTLGGAWRAGTGTRERFLPGSPNYLLLPDGGKVEFSSTWTSRVEQLDESRPPITYYSYFFKTEAIIDPYGQRIVYSYNPDNSLYRVTEPGGRYIQFSYGTGGITSIQSSDGRTVVYNYSTVALAGATAAYTLLISVGYFGDSAWDAAYTYQIPNTGSANGIPLLATCNDTMSGGPMKKIAYVYQTGNNPNGAPAVYGQISSENYFSGSAVGAAVSTLTMDNAATRTETRGIGGSRTFDYNTITGLLTSVTDFKGVAETRAYDGNRYLSAITDRRGSTTNLTNNGFTGGVTQVQYPLTGFDGGVRSTAQTVFGYPGCPDPNNQDANNPYYPYSVTNERGYTTTFLRDANKRVIQINYPTANSYETFAYNGFGNVVSHRMPSGGIETFAYDGSNGRLLSRTPPATPSDPNPGAHPTQYAYDGYGRVSGVTDPRGNHTWFQYSQRGQVTKVTHQDNTYRQMGYNPDGTLAWSADENHPGAATDPNQRTRYVYDDYKRVISVTNLLNKTASFNYAQDWVNSYLHTTANPKAVTAPSGKQTHLAYDENWRRWVVREAPGTVDDAWTFFGYDAAGNSITVLDPRGHVTTRFYDQRNRLTDIDDPIPGNRNSNGHTVSWTYDAAGNKRTELRANNQFITFDNYDEMNRPRLQQMQRESGITDLTELTYDLAGNLTALRDPRGKIYSYEYDALNRKTVSTYPIDATGAARQERNTYDFVGNLATFRNRAEATQTFTYDNRNRPTNYWWSDGTWGQNTEYDAASRIQRIWNGPGGSLSWTYLDDNSVQSETQLSYGDWLPRTVTYSYDDDGNRQTIGYPTGLNYTYVYTQRNQVKTINDTGAGPGWGPAVAYAYDAAGNLTQRSHRNGTYTNFATADALNRISTVQSYFTGGNYRFDYGFDEMSRRTFEQRNVGAADGYGYDLSGQVKTFNREGVLSNGTVTGGAIQALNYDANGNRTSVVTGGATTNYTASDANQYRTIDGATLGYDPNGNLAAQNGWSTPTTR